MTKGEDWLKKCHDLLNASWRGDILRAILTALCAIYLAQRGSLWFILPALGTCAQLWPYLIPDKLYQSYADKLDKPEDEEE